MPLRTALGEGVFLAFQYPVEIPGVATMTFLRTALNAQRKERAASEFSTPDFLRRCARLQGLPFVHWNACCAHRGVDIRVLQRREEAQRDSADGAVPEPSLAISDARWIPASTSGALRVAADGVEMLALA